MLFGVVYPIYLKCLPYSVTELNATKSTRFKFAQNSDTFSDYKQSER